MVVKVQRQGIYNTMARDIKLLHRAVKLLPPVSLKELVDLDLVLDEFWNVAVGGDELSHRSCQFGGICT